MRKIWIKVKELIKNSFKKKQTNQVIQYYIMNEQFEIMFAYEAYSEYLLRNFKRLDLKFPEGEVFVINHNSGEYSWFSSNVDSLYAVAENNKQAKDGYADITMREYIEMMHYFAEEKYLHDIEMCDDSVFRVMTDC